MMGQFAPVNLLEILGADFAHPALVGGNKLRLVSQEILGRTIHINNRIAKHRTGVAENRRSGDRRGLEPHIFSSIVNLHRSYQFAILASADQVDVTILVNAGNGVSYRIRNVSAPE